MFGDTLLESSSASRNRKRWPMAAAFIAEMIVAGIVVMIPLLSTGAISISAHSLPVPFKPMPLEAVKPVQAETVHSSGRTAPAGRTVVIMANDNPNAIHWKSQILTTNERSEITPPGYESTANNRTTTALFDSGFTSNVKPGPKRVISQLTEAQLLNRVEPVYPHIAALSGIQGQVRLHAIIARDGSIQSLNVTSGHPMLAIAALEAVRQWRYRPYILNGEAVEVETLITVNFRKEVR
jgi:periplasmic protein TonB